MLHKLTENVFYSEQEEKTDRPCIGYVRGNKYSLMIDSGNSCNNVNKFMGFLKSINLAMPDFVAITHSHWDHSFGISYIDAVSIACDKTNVLLKNMKDLKWNSALLSEYVHQDTIPLFCEPHIRLEYPDLTEIKVKPTDISFANEMILDLGNQPCVLKNVVSPHTDDCIIVYVPNERVIFLGDAIYEELVRDEWVSHNDKLSKLVEELEKLDFDVAVEGHFAPKTKNELIFSLKEKL